MEFVGAFTIAAPIAVGAFGVLFSRKASLMFFRYREEVFGRRYSQTEVRIGQISWAFVGAVLLIGGLVVAVQQLLP